MTLVHLDIKFGAAGLHFGFQRLMGHVWDASVNVGSKCDNSGRVKQLLLRDAFWYQVDLNMPMVFEMMFESFLVYPAAVKDFYF